MRAIRRISIPLPDPKDHKSWVIKFESDEFQIDNVLIPSMVWYERSPNVEISVLARDWEGIDPAKRETQLVHTYSRYFKWYGERSNLEHVPAGAYVGCVHGIQRVLYLFDMDYQEPDPGIWIPSDADNG